MSEKVPHANVLVGLQFHGDIQTAWGTHLGVTIGRNVTFIRPARIEFDGAAVACDKGQTPTGWLLEHTTRHPSTQQQTRMQAFVPFGYANVHYGLPVEKK